MSIIPSGLARQNFYLSGPLPCPYLPARVERKLFTYLNSDRATDTELNAALTRAGFRRSHDILYRPACDGCSACIPVRVPVARFQPSRGQRRVATHNRDLSFAPVEADAIALYPLFNAYQCGRHADSDMARMSEQEFAHMLNDAQVERTAYGLRDGTGALLAAILTDTTGDGASAVYSFFDPAQPRRSLGVQLVLSLIEKLREENLPWLYLGYWIAAARKMSYKAQYRPLQALGPQGWEDIAL